MLAGTGAKAARYLGEQLAGHAHDVLLGQAALLQLAKDRLCKDRNGTRIANRGDILGGNGARLGLDGHG